MFISYQIIYKFTCQHSALGTWHLRSLTYWGIFFKISHALPCRNQVMDRQKAIKGYVMRVTWRMKMSMAKHFVGAVEAITVPMNSGLAVTSVRGGTMGSV